MAMDGTVDQTLNLCLQALEALYHSPDQATKRQADEWLTTFQQQPQAWQVSDHILTNANSNDVRFFAAQTMRTKVQFDFFQLPAESYTSLRDSLLAHIDRFRAPEFQSIHTMLAVTLADLAIQMDSEWPQPVEMLFARFGSTPDSYPTLLEILRMLPEEQINYKLMTDTYKRNNSGTRMREVTPQVVQFLMTIQCPNAQAKKKVLECFLSWVKFTSVQATDIAQTGLIPECVQFVVDGNVELAETATDIVIEILRMCSMELRYYEPVITVMISLLSGLRAKFDALMAHGAEAALDKDLDGMLQICRIYVETGECLIPHIMTQSNNPEVNSILQVIMRCTDLPSQEIAQIPLDFWHRLSSEVCRHPEVDVKIDQFKSIYVELLKVMMRRCMVSKTEDPFQADDDYVDYRGRLLRLAEDCLDILTPNSALDTVLESLKVAQKEGVTAQEAHFYCLTTVGARAEVQEGSVLWVLIQSLPQLISQPVPEDTIDGALLLFTKKTAIDLLGQLSAWLRTKPDFLTVALEMISQLLLQQTPANSPMHVVERMKQVQQAASMAFKEICVHGQHFLPEVITQLTTLYVQTMHLSIRMHGLIVDGVAAVVAHMGVARGDAEFQAALEAIVTPLVTGMNTEAEKPQVLSEILDRLTFIVRQIQVPSGSAKAAAVGMMITNYFWPLIRQTIAQHPADSKVVEKGCRLLKHSLRCVPDLFKPHVPEVAMVLIPAFQAHQHSSYLYTAEFLADAYASDHETVPVLTSLFNQLSQTALTVISNSQSRLEEITELVEDFFGMFERFLRFAPTIVLEAPTLPHVMQLWHIAIFVQQKESVEAIIAFIEAVFSLIAAASNPSRGHNRPSDQSKMAIGQRLRAHAVVVGPGFVEALMKLIASVPTRYVQEVLPDILDSVRSAFPQEFPAWLEAAVNHLPPSAASKAEQQKFGEQMVRGGYHAMNDAVQDLCYRCEQVALRTRGKPAQSK